MLQRIQSVFLALALVAVALTFFMPSLIIRFKAEGEITAVYNNYGLVSVTSAGLNVLEPGYNYLLGALALLFILFAVFQFKRRKLQIMLCRVTYGVLLAMVVLNFFMPGPAIETLKTNLQVESSVYGMAFYMPLLAMFFVFLAETFIKRDEKLVKSADRLR
ncbi:MAG TPA: DUF4293 domain-containing protein [Flavobacteriales bacterium]|nr:DUF4293 domain-containing protein [Flavobacteriales bacterium]